MKLTTLPILIFSLLAISPSLLAQEKSFDPLGNEAEASLPRNIRIQVEFIELSLKESTALMADAKATKTDTLLRERLTALIKADDAKMLATQIVVGRSGEKMTTESIREFIYPTEYETPKLPGSFGTDKATAKKTDLTDLATPPTPTAFEIRNLGSTLEVEPTIGEHNRTIDVRLSPEIVYHVENIKWATWKNKQGEADIQMPIFYTLRINTAVSVTNGKPCFVGALSPKDDQGVTDFTRQIFVFVKCDIMSIGR